MQTHSKEIVTTLQAHLDKKFKKWCIMEIRRVPGYRKGSVYFTCDADREHFYLKKTTKANGTTYLVCTEKNCPARAIYNAVQFEKLGENHQHLPDIAREEALVLKNTMITSAISSSEEIKSIYVRKSAGATVAAASQIAFPSVSKSMRRQRSKHQPDMPTSLQEFGDICNRNLRFGFIDDKPFCRGTVGNGTSTAVIFLAEDLIPLLREGKEVHIDGTFKTRPRQPESSQLLTITVIQYGIAFPCAFALMASRNMEAYNTVFQKFLEIVPRWKPKLIMTDFEAALIKSLRHNFPESSKNGCFFHYCQAIMRQSRMLGLTNLLKNNNMALKAVKYLMSLPLLPAENFGEGLEFIRRFLEENTLTEDFSALLRYHENQWLRRVGANSVSVFNRKRRTNNDAESFHAALIRFLRIRGPNVWEFTDGLRNICANVIRELRAFIDEGLTIRSLSKNKYRANDRRIQNATAQFIRDKNVASFLNMVAYSTQGIINRALAVDENEREEDQEQLLAPLEGDVPAGYEAIDARTNARPTDIAEEEEEEEDNENVNIGNEPSNQPILSNNDAGVIRTGDAVCSICKDVPPTTILIPCGHFGLCGSCSDEIQDRITLDERPDEDTGVVVNFKICPLDRIQIDQFIRVVTT